MLNSNGLRQIIEQLRLIPEALEILAAVRGRPPSRHVNQAFGNVSARYPSRKMGWTIQAESHRVELAAIHDMEYDANVLEYYDQPGTIPLRYRAISGRAVSVQHTPDFFVIRRDWIGWEEWKPEARLRDLARLMPGRYALANGGESGDWRCPPGEAYARQVGLNYRVRSDAEIDWTMQRNIQFMADYWRAGGSVSDDLIVKKIHAWFVHEQTEGMREVMPLTEVLLRANEGGIASDKVYAMIALGELWVDLRAAPLAEPQRVMVHLTPSEDSLEKRAVNPILADTDVEALPSHIVLRQLTQEGRTILQTASPQALAVANDRWAALRSVLDQAGDINSASDAVIPERTLFRWRRRIREAEQKYGSGYVGLLPRYGERGNRNRRLDAEVLTLMDQLAEDTYETAKRRNVKSVFGTLVIECQDRALTAPSYRTFLRVIKMRPRVKLMERREGKRSAYVATPFYWELNLTTPRHGDRPFEIGHIDHTELDIELVCSLTGRPLGRPWLTFLVDAFSRRVLAFWLSYEPPSYRSCMMILRECVRRHHRLPQTIVVDGGKEFESVYFETLLARYECTKKTRPGAKPRFGSVCERLFGITNTLFVHNLAGNTQNSKDPRRGSRTHDPKRHARWTLPKLFEYLQNWMREVYDTREHPALDQSPLQAFEMGQTTMGARTFLSIAYDDDFITQTMPTTQKGTARVHEGHGVTINHICYWSDAFRNPSVIGQAVPVRFDPFDAGVAYAYAQGGWKRCISDHFAHLSGRSHREVALITAELRKRKQNSMSAAHSQVTSAQIARFVAAAEEQEEILAQRLRDAETRHVMRLVQGDGGNPLTEQAKSGMDAIPVTQKSVQEGQRPSRSGKRKIYPDF